MPRTLRSGLKALVAALAVALVTPTVQADPPPWAPAHGRRAQDRVVYDRVPDYGGEPPILLDAGRCNRDLIGSLIGGAAGGVLGSELSDGDTVAIIGGAVLGALIGGAIGESMDQADQTCVGQVLEYGPQGRTIGWGGQQGARYQVTPFDIFVDDRGRQCRRYTVEALIDGRWDRATRRACRRADGLWELLS